MTRPPRPRDRPLLDRGILGGIVGAGGFSAVGALVILLVHPGPFEHARWLAFTTLVLAQAVRAYANRSLEWPISRLPTNAFLAIVGLVVVLVQAAIPAVPPLAEAFRATPLSAEEWAVAALVALVPAAVAELVRSRSGRVAWVA